MIDETSPWLVLGGFDARAEWQASRKRSKQSMECWAFLAARYADLKSDQSDAAGDEIAAAPGLYFFRSGTEAMIYRLCADGPQIVAVGEVRDGPGRGALISEGQRRFALINKAKKT